MPSVHYRKLVRDKIPDIISAEGRDPVTSALAPHDQLYHLRLKLIEESHELFRATNGHEFTTEAADVLQVLHSLAAYYGVDWNLIEEARIKREIERGGFDDGVYLHAVYDERNAREDDAKVGFDSVPCLITPNGNPSLLDLLRQELNESKECRIATAFVNRAMINLLMKPLERFLSKGGVLQLIASTMNDFNNPDDLLHIKFMLPGAQLKVFFPGSCQGPARFHGNPPAFHLKCFMFKRNEGRHSLIVGSSNMTGGGLVGNEEWNFYSNSEVNLSFAKDDELAKSRFCSLREHFWRSRVIQLKCKNSG